MIKVIHISEDMSVSGGGVASAIKELANNCNCDDFQHEIVTTTPDKDLIPGINVPIASIEVSTIAKSWKYSNQLINILKKKIQDGRTIIHLHGIWMAPQYIGATFSHEFQVPCALSPHNMLGEWFWKGWPRKIKKKIYWQFAKRKFRNLKSILALSNQEKKQLEAYFPQENISVIPNGVDLNEIERQLSHAEINNRERYILFLGRLHPVKGIDAIIKAYSLLGKDSRLPLKIAGPPHTQKYLSYLADLINRCDLNEAIQFVGPVYGQPKWKLLRNAWALLAPSHSEGISMSALEAMGCGVPVISTPNCGIDNLEEGGGGTVSGNSKELRAVIEEINSWTKEERAFRGRQARSYVENQFSWDILKVKYQRLYLGLKS